MPEIGVSEEYRNSIAGAVSVIEAFNETSKVLRDRYSGKANPARECPALTELLHQSDFAGFTGDQPVDNLASMIDLLILAGLDSLRAVGMLIGSEPVFVWAHLPTGRAVLETFAYARWLTECPLDRATRVKRSLLMSLDDAVELARFGIPELSKQSTNQKDSIRRTAAANSWDVSISKMMIGGEELIKTKAALDRLFGDPEGVRSAAPKLWSYLFGSEPRKPLRASPEHRPRRRHEGWIHHHRASRRSVERHPQPRRDASPWRHPDLGDGRPLFRMGGRATALGDRSSHSIPGSDQSCARRRRGLSRELTPS